MTPYSQNCSVTTIRDSKNTDSCCVASDFFISSEVRYLFFVGYLVWGYDVDIMILHCDNTGLTPVSAWECRRCICERCRGGGSSSPDSTGSWLNRTRDRTGHRSSSGNGSTTYIPRPVRATDFSRKSLINFPLVMFWQSLRPTRNLLGMKGEVQPYFSSNNKF